MRSTQVSPEVLIGLFADLPNPAEISLGYFFFATDTIQLFVLKIDAATQARTWVQTSGAGSLPGIPFDQVAVGSVGGTGLTSSANFTYDPASGLLTARDTNGAILFTLDGNPANRLFSLLSAAGASVFSFNTVTNTFAHAVPASPQYFVASTGSNTNAGTLTSPLATVAEALRRLAISSWSGQPIVTVVDAVNEGLSPLWNIPKAPSGAMPVLVRGTTSNILVGMNPTGGTAGDRFTPTAATITTGVGMVANAHVGLFVLFTAGPLSGQKAVIDANTAGGIFTLGGTLTAAPVPGDLFNVIDVPAVTFTGTLALTMPSGCLFDSLALSGPQFSLVAGAVVPTGIRLTAPGTGMKLTVGNGAAWCDNSTLYIPPIPLAAGQIKCGSRYSGGVGRMSAGDAAISTIGGFIGIAAGSLQNVDFNALSASVEFRIENVSQTLSCSAYVFWAGSKLGILGSFVTTPHANLGTTCIFTTDRGVALNCYFTSITGAPAGVDIFNCNGSTGTLNTVSGANPGAGAQLRATAGTSLQVTGNTFTAGTNVFVGSNNSCTMAQAQGGTAPLSTDFNAASTGVATSQGCRVGP